MLGEEFGPNCAIGMYPPTINKWFWGDLMMYLGAVAYRWSAIRYLVQVKRRSVVLLPGGFYEIDQPPHSTGLHIKLNEERKKLLAHAYAENTPVMLSYCPAEAKLCIVYRNHNFYIDAIREGTRKHIFNGHHSWPTRFIGPLPFRTLTIYTFNHRIKRRNGETFPQFHQRVEDEYRDLKKAALQHQKTHFDVTLNPAPSWPAHFCPYIRRTIE